MLEHPIDEPSADDGQSRMSPTPVESTGSILARPLAILVVLCGIAGARWREAARPANPPVVVKAKADPSPAVVAAPTPDPVPAARPPDAEPVEPRSIPVDQAAVARAEESLDHASTLRAIAEARLADAERDLQAATVRLARDMADGKASASKVRDPSARIASASSKGGFLKGERDRLKDELIAIEKEPQAKAQPLMAKSAVAKPTDGTEYHFEVRRGRVAFIDLDRLVDMVKTDARLKLRSGGTRGRLGSTVGPVGSFSLRYEMGRAIPEALSDMFESRDVTYNLLGWELIPESANRGETYEATRTSSSHYARAVHQLSPGRDTVTMWIYPDGFALYRQLRDDLHARGFLVAARPLPEGTSIKGSPSGSLSAGQ